MSLLITGTSEEPGALTQGAPVFPGSSRLGIEPKTPGWLVQDPTTKPIGDLIPFGNRTKNSRVAGARPNHQADRGSDPNHRGIWSQPMAGLGPEEE